MTEVIKINESKKSPAASKMDLNLHLHLIGYHIGDIWASPDWNRSRWEQIYETIRAKSPNLIVLHEVSAEARRFFRQLSLHGYQIFRSEESSPITIFYIRLKFTLNYGDIRRFRIELPPVLKTHPLIEPSNLVQLRFNFEAQNFDLYGLTLAPASREDLDQSLQTLMSQLDPQIPTLISVLIAERRFIIKPPAPLLDAWDILGWTHTSNSTGDNFRANQIWIHGFTPIIIGPVGDGIYHGLSAKFKPGSLKKHSRSQSWVEINPTKFLRASSSLEDSRAPQRLAGCALL